MPKFKALFYIHKLFSSQNAEKWAILKIFVENCIKKELLSVPIKKKVHEKSNFKHIDSSSVAVRDCLLHQL